MGKKSVCVIFNLFLFNTNNTVFQIKLVVILSPFKRLFTDFFLRKERAFSMLLLCWNIPLPLSRLWKPQKGESLRSQKFLAVGWKAWSIKVKLDLRCASHSSPPAGPAVWSHHGNHWTDLQPCTVASSVTNIHFVYVILQQVSSQVASKSPLILTTTYVSKINKWK